MSVLFRMSRATGGGRLATSPATKKSTGLLNGRAVTRLPQTRAITQAISTLRQKGLDYRLLTGRVTTKKIETESAPPSHLKSIADVATFKEKNVSVIVGNGMITKGLIKEAFQHDPNAIVIVCSSKSGVLEKLADMEELQDRLLFQQTGYEEGKRSAFWRSIGMKIAEKQPNNVRVINTRGVGSPGPGETFEDVLIKPTLACAQGTYEGVQSTAEKANQSAVPYTFVNCSSAVSLVEGFDTINAYAAARKRTFEQLSENEIPGISLEIDYVWHDQEDPMQTEVRDGANNSNHTYSFSQIASLLRPLQLQVSIGDKHAKAIQPVSENDLFAAALSPRAFKAGAFRAIPAVGPKTYSQDELAELFSQALGCRKNIVELPIEILQWVARYAPEGHLAEYAIDLLHQRGLNPHINAGHDHTSLEELVGHPLTSLEDIYQRHGAAALTDDSRPPIARHIGRIIRALRSNPEAIRSLIAISPKLPVAVGAMLRGMLRGLIPSAL